MKNLEKNFNPEGKYFLFNIYDSWTEKQDSCSYGDGFELYQLIKGDMKEKVTITCGGNGFAPSEERIILFLKKNDIKEIYNPLPEIAGEFKGAEGYNKPDQDGDVLIRNFWESREQYPFEIDRAGIKLIGFD